MTYQPYKNLKSLQNDEPFVETGFNYDGYSRFMNDNFTIVNKDQQEVPFTQQPAQMDFLYHMSLYQKLLILKARKMGFSSTALGVATAKFITGRHEKCVTMSFDQSAANKQLARAKHYIQSYETIMSKKTGLDFKLPLKYNTKTEMVLEGKDPETGESWRNVLQVGTAKSNSFGRGDDITFLHLTEVSLVDDIETLLSGVGEAVLRGAHTILETTANGFNSYKKFWDKSVLNETGYAALFYSPLWEYTQEYVDEKYRSLGRLGVQEYPMTPIDAFVTSGSAYFDKDALAEYLKMVRQPV